MISSDRKKGKFILIVASILFLYYTAWVIALPFIGDNRIRLLFGSQSVALTMPAVFGLCFIGGLILFTFYHIKPHLSYKKANKRLE